MSSLRRHLLVIASQCESMGPLERLMEASRALQEVLVSDLHGHCVAGLPDGRSLLCGQLDGEDITTTVKAAVEYAATKEATLVLALLGHGFTLEGTSSPLYLMGWRSIEGETRTAVNVGELLGYALSERRVNGVIGVIDACHAAAAQPNAQELIAGSRSGQTRLSLLMASTAPEDAFGLQLSLELAALLRRGMESGQAALYMTDLLQELRRRIGTQTVVSSSYDGDGLAEGALWVAHNVKYVAMPAEGWLGPLGSVEVATALRALNSDHPALRYPLDADTLRKLRDEFPLRDAAHERARRAVGNAYVAQKTVTFLGSRLRRTLSTKMLRRALTLLWASESYLEPLPQWPTLVEATDLVTFNPPVSHRDSRAWVAKFVWLLSSLAGIEANDEDLWTWAGSIDATIELRDAMDFVGEIGEEQQLRLMISLTSLAGDWPETLDAWLYCDGKRHDTYSRSCPAATQSGTEQAMREVLELAHLTADDLGMQLRRVDVAAPAAILLKWRPERVETSFGGEYLGVGHDVVTHWNGRLYLPTSLRGTLQAVLSRLRNIANCTSGMPLDWLADHDTREVAALQKRLKMGHYMRGIGLQEHPGDDTQVMELLFGHIPIVLWPQVDASFPPERQSGVHDLWASLPEAFFTAYRRDWQGSTGGDLADLRAVWDDHEWLALCRLIAPRPTNNSRSES